VPAWTLAAEQSAGDGSAADRIAAAIRHAETYYALGMAEHGDPRAAEAGRRKLEHAQELLEQAGLPPDEADRIGKRIAALDGDLEAQIARARGTLGGVFPLTRFLASPLLANSGPTATYRLIDDPAIQATKDAATDLAAQVGELEKKSGPLPVVLTAVLPEKTEAGAAPGAGQNRDDQPPARALEHAAGQVFRGLPRFQVKTYAAVAKALTPAEKEAPRTALEDFQAGHISSAVSDRLLKEFGPRVLLVTIRRADVTRDVDCYQTEGQILEATNKPQQQTFVSTGLGRDRRARLAWILWANVALLVAAYGMYALLAYARGALAGHNSWLTLLLLPLVAFVVGRTLPYAVVPLLGSIRLPADTPALASFWIACLAGLGFLGGPLLAYWLAAPWLAEFWPRLSPGNRGGALFVAMGAGIAAYLAGPMLLYLEKHAAVDVILMSASVMVLAYLLGRTLDHSDPLPLSLAFVPVFLTMPAGAALLHADTTWLGLATAAIVATGAAVVAGHAMVRKRRSRALACRRDESLTGPERLGDGIPADVQELVRRAESPDFQRFPSFDRAWERMSDFLEGRCCRLGVFGSRGAGKTATVGAITKRLVQELERSGSRPALLCGTCPQPISEPISYAPFREALAQHFEVNLLAPPGPKLQQISEALGGLFGSVIPFARILFPRSAGSGDAAVRPDEINASIVWMLRRLSQTRPILLFLDDVQWLDEASTALVKYLLEAFPAGGNTPVAVILVAHSKSCLADLGFDVAREGIEIAYPSVAEQVQILVRGIGLQAAVAEEVLARTGAARESDGGLLWPLQVAAKLARSGALVRSEEGFAWANGVWPADFAVPPRMQAAIQEQWQSAEPYRAVLACAACGCEGREFRVGVLADALGRTRLDLLIVLDEIERTTGLVHDVRERDDLYAFHSSFLLEVIRGQLGIAGGGARKADVPQLVREYHARLAVALEAALGTSRSGLYEVANHFHAAGARYAAKGVEYCLEGASASAAGYDFRRANHYLEMAAECAEFAPAGPAVEMEKQVIRCQEAQVTLQGAEREQAAASGLAYLTEHADAPARLILALAELCYDVGHRSRERKWYEEAKRLCQRVVAAPGSPQEEARALHIMVISQPRERREERLTGLRQAYRLLEDSKPEDREASQWFASIMNSLAKELRKGTAQEQAEAKVLFQCRLRMEKERSLGDLRGVAMALGGLGRLEWFGTPRNPPDAEQYFCKSLDMAEAIDDVVAQVKMLSLLGECALERGDVKQAAEHYENSWKKAGDPEDRCFAGIGLLRCCQKTSDRDRFQSVAKQLLELLQEDRENREKKIPDDCRNPLRAVLQACSAESGSDTVRSLLDLL
jgi:hypothetical protein